jgi:acetyl esterase
MQSRNNRVDPQIQRFMQQLAEDYACHPPIDSVGIEDQRRIMASVRARWAVGGPVMARTSEFVVPVDVGAVRVRVYYPTVRQAMPALLYAHGGGWKLFDLDTHDRLMREYAARAEVVVVGIDYARAPEARFPVALEQMIGVIRWLGERGHFLGIDVERIAVGGDSAGANLALSSALGLRDQGLPHAVRALVLNYGAFDTAMTSDSYQCFGNGEYLLASAEMAGFWNDYLRSPADAANPYACPALAELVGLPPTFLAVADLDILRDENVAIAEKLRHAGVDVQCTVYPGTVHGFIEAVAVASITAVALDDAARWLQASLSSRPRHCRS